MDERPPKRSLFDDPDFLASVSELDRGLAPDGAPRPSAPVDPPAPTPDAPELPRPAPAPTPAPTAPSDSDSAVPLPPPRSSTTRRPLIDLFPPRSKPPSLRPPVEREPPRLDVARALRGEPPRSDAPATYETFYGLARKPFGLDADPAFLYHSTSHDRAAQAIADALVEEGGVTVVTGERGIGKTMLCRAIVEQRERRTLASSVGEPFGSAEDLLKTMLVDFGVIERDEIRRGSLRATKIHDLVETLRSFLASLSALQATAVLIVDDAHSLPLDVLDYLRELATSDGIARVLHIVLVGEPTLASILNRGELKPLEQRIASRVALDPLASDEVIGYVVHRLAVAGTNARVEFDDAALRSVFEWSGGVPRVVNVLCDRALALGCESSASVIEPEVVERAAIDLDLTPPQSTGGTSALHRTILAVVVLLFAIGGAAAAGWVLRDRIAAGVAMWEGVPPAPAAPVLPRPAPLAIPVP